MARINLLGGTYQARSVIADAQRCVNLYPEANPGSDTDHPVTHYLTPGTSLLAKPPVAGPARCEYRASNGNYYRVIGYNVYSVNSNWVHTLLGVIQSGANICYMADNGLVVVLVDGSLTAYAINLSSITGIETLDVSTSGSGYTDGTYTEVPLIGGTGSGALATINITGGKVFSASLDYAGSNYNVGDKLTFSSSAVGITGTGGKLIVVTLIGYQFAPITSPAYLGATKVDYLDTFFMFNVPQTNEWYITLGEPSYQVLTGTIGSIVNGSIDASGTGYIDGTYNNVVLTGGSGTGATATVVISGGSVTIVQLTNPGENYTIGDALGLTASMGEINTTTITSGGSGYPNGTYTGVPLTGGSGTGAIATVTVTSGAVTNLVFTNQGTNYTVGDILSSSVAYLGGTGSGFTAMVDTLVTTGSESPYSGIGATTLTDGGTGYVPGIYTGVPLTGGSGTGAVATITVNGSGIVSTAVLTNFGVNYIIGDALSASNTSLGGTGSGLVLTVSSLNGNGFDYVVGTIAGAGFDPTDIASKTGSPDPIVNIAVVHTEIWLIGELTTEIWYNAGAPTFTFQRLPGTFVEHGCAAPYSLARNDLSLFWLSQDRAGQTIVVMSQSYQLIRISTHAIENVFATYESIADAIGYTYQQEGHIFYVLTFPSANATWVYDVTIQLWHQRAITDNNGKLNQIRGTVCAFVFTSNIVGDYQTGNLLIMKLNQTTDYVDGLGLNSDGSYPISRIRGFPHMVEDFDRLSYRSFIADMEAGNDDGSIDGSTPVSPPLVSLRWSDNRGRSYGNKIEQSLGSAGQYLTTLQFNRLGYARDRVFELSWSAPTLTALQGAFIEVIKEAT